MPAYGTVDTSTSTPVTSAPTNPAFEQAAALFQHCLGVSNARDRVFGASGQLPDYQASSRVFTSPSYGGIQVASTLAVLPDPHDGRARRGRDVTP